MKPPGGGKQNCHISVVWEEGIRDIVIQKLAIALLISFIIS